MTIAGTRFDQEDGLGSTPNNQNVNYMGFVVFMRPSEFLALNPDREQPPTLDMAAHIQEGGSIASPFLEVSWENGRWRVRGHEGRGRMAALVELGRDEPVPVQMFGRGEYDRARDISQSQVLSAIHSDSRQPNSFVFLPERALHDRQPVDRDQEVTEFFQSGPVARISTRKPTVKDAPEDVMDRDRLVVSTDSYQKPEAREKAIRILADYPNFRPRKGESADALLGRVKKQLVENPIFLHNEMPVELRERARHWYKGANRLSRRMATRYGVEHHAAAAVLAALSPQKIGS